MRERVEVQLLNWLLMEDSPKHYIESHYINSIKCMHWNRPAIYCCGNICIKWAELSTK
jgi:hypothetical protein